MNLRYLCQRQLGTVFRTIILMNQVLEVVCCVLGLCHGPNVENAEEAGHVFNDPPNHGRP